MPTASDHTPPPAPTGLDLVASSDTGRSDHDDITSDQTPTLRADAEAGTLVRFYVDGSLAGSARANSPVEWTSGPLGDGPHRFTATAEDAAGNLSPPSAALVVTIDTVAPVVASLDLDAASDSVPVGDGETTAASVTLVGQSEPGADVVLEGTGRARSRTTRAGSRSRSVPLALGTNDVHRSRHRSRGQFHRIPPHDHPGRRVPRVRTPCSNGTR